MEKQKIRYWKAGKWEEDNARANMEKQNSALYEQRNANRLQAERDARSSDNASTAGSLLLFIILLIALACIHPALAVIFVVFGLLGALN